jgi:hypothetical protein
MGESTPREETYFIRNNAILILMAGRYAFPVIKIILRPAGPVNQAENNVKFFTRNQSELCEVLDVKQGRA